MPVYITERPRQAMGGVHLVPRFLLLISGPTWAYILGLVFGVRVDLPVLFPGSLRSTPCLFLQPHSGVSFRLRNWGGTKMELRSFTDRAAFVLTCSVGCMCPTDTLTSTPGLSFPSTLIIWCTDLPHVPGSFGLPVLRSFIILNPA